MAKQVQFRRGTAAENDAFTGAVGEITVDTTNKQLRVHDGSTAGGTSALAGSAIGVSVQGYDADTAKTDVEQTFTAPQRGAITALTSAATITIDLDNTNFYSVTLDTNATFANPSNVTVGQAGSIFITQDGTGSRTASWGSQWKFIGGTAPTLTTTAAAVDRIDYVVKSATEIHAVATLNYTST
jgi:hypothetical protein